VAAVRLLVTRPKPDASALAAKLRALGHAALVQPMLRIELAGEPADLPANPAAVVLTGRNGVRALAAWPAAAAWHDLPAYAVGEATGAALRAAGFRNVRVGGGDGATLAALIAAERTGGDGPILVVAGRDRAIDMAAALPDLPVRTLEAYRAVAAEALAVEVRAALADHAIDAVLLYSPRSAAVFTALVRAAGLTAELAEVNLFCLSDAVAEPVLALAARRILVPPRPDEASLLEVLRWFSDGNGVL
jgi:uroporphyrinogen-III synthase